METLGIGNYTLPVASLASSFTRQFITHFQQGLKALSDNVNGDEALAVMSAAHSNFYGGPIHVQDFDGVVPNRYAGCINGCKRYADENGVVQIGAPVYRREGLFQLHFNALRGLKPVSVKRSAPIRIDEPFDPSGWHFGRIPNGEIFMTTAGYEGIRLSFIYNLLPFAPLHFLMLPQSEEGERNQSFSDFRVLREAWEFVSGSGDPNLRLGFNALGAYASINHLHWQGFYVTNEWQQPIDRLIDHVDVPMRELTGWPLRFTTVFKINSADNLGDVFACIAEIQKRAAATDSPSISFNLYVRPDSITIFPRKHQTACDEYVHERATFTTGPAFFELGGTIIVTTWKHYQSVTFGQVEALLEAISLDERPF